MILESEMLTLHFKYDDTVFSLTKPSYEIKYMQQVLGGISPIYYPISKISEDTYELIPNDIFSPSALIYRILLLCGIIEGNQDLPKELPY